MLFGQSKSHTQVPTQLPLRGKLLQCKAEMLMRYPCTAIQVPELGIGVVWPVQESHTNARKVPSQRQTAAMQGRETDENDFHRHRYSFICSQGRQGR